VDTIDMSQKKSSVARSIRDQNDVLYLAMRRTSFADGDSISKIF